MDDSSNSFRETVINFCDIPDAKLYYKIMGAGPPIIFIHGFCLDHRIWESQSNFFSACFTTVAIDLRGFGNSSNPGNKPYSHHEDVNTLLDILQINQPAILVGLSMGARVVANYALTYPQKTKAVIFVDGIV